MIIRRLLIEPFKDMDYCEIELNINAELLAAEDAEAVTEAASVLLKINETPFVFRKSDVPFKRVEAEISINDDIYYLKAEKILNKINYIWSAKTDN